MGVVFVVLLYGKMILRHQKCIEIHKQQVVSKKFYMIVIECESCMR